MYQEISFPELGLTLNPSRVAFSIGGKDFYWYGIIIAVGFLLAVAYGIRRSRQFGLTQDNIIDMLICAVPSAVVCARAYYCLFKWELYRDDPIRVLFIWEGGLAIYGGIIGSVLAVIIFTKVKHIRTSAMLDRRPGSAHRPEHRPLGELYQPGGPWRRLLRIFADGAHRCLRRDGFRSSHISL